MEQRKTVSTLNYATTAIVAASTGMVLARPESPLFRRNDVHSPSSSPLTSRYSASPMSSRDHSPFPDGRASITTPNGGSPSIQTTGWINNSPQKKQSPPSHRADTPLSTESVGSSSSSGRKPAKLRRRTSTKSPPFFGWRSKSKSPPVEEAPASPLTINHEEHYHLYDIGTRDTRPSNARQSIASISQLSPNNPRTPLKRIYPPPQKNDTPRLVSPNSLCQVQSCGGTPSPEQLRIKTLRRMTSDGNLSPTRSSGHKRNQSVPSFDSGKPNTPSPEHDTDGWGCQTPSRTGEGKTVWLVSDTPHEDNFASQARRRLEFDSKHMRGTSVSSMSQRISSQSPPPVIPERCDSLNWDSESDPTYESMKTDPGRRKTRISGVFDDTDYDRAVIPDHQSPRTVVTLLPRKDSVDDLDWGDDLSISNGHPNLSRRLPMSTDVDILNIPARKSSLSRSKSVPPNRPDASPERLTKRLSAPKECWDNDFEDEGADMWQIPENITDAQDKLKGYLDNIRMFSGIIEDLKRFRQAHPRTHRRRISQEQLLDEIDAMIEISTLDGFTPPPFSGPPLSPKKSTPSLASSQWSFEDRFASFAIDDERRIPTPPTATVSDPPLDPKHLQARQLLERILGESDDLRMEVKPEQLTKMIEFVSGLKSRCDDFEAKDGRKTSWNIGLGVYV